MTTKVQPRITSYNVCYTKLLRLQEHPFPFRKVVAESGADGHGDELDRAVQGQGQRVALQQRSGDHAGEDVPGAGVAGRDVRAGDLPVALGVPVVGDDRGAVGQILSYNFV